MSTNPNLLLAGYNPKPYAYQAPAAPQQNFMTGAVAPDPSLPAAQPVQIPQVAPAASNVMQPSAVDPLTLQSPPTIQPSVDSSQMPVAPVTDLGSPVPRNRMSLAEIIGHVGDTMAALGGKEQLYRAGIEHNQDRPLQLQGEKLDVGAKQLDQQQTQGAIQDATNTRVHNFAQALQTVQEQGGDVAQAAASLGPSMGIDAAVGSKLAANPHLIDGLVNYGNKIGMTGSYGKTPIPILDNDGNTHIAFSDPKGQLHFADGYTGNNGINFTKGVNMTNLGGTMQATDKLTGRTVGGGLKVTLKPLNPNVIANLRARTAGTEATTGKTIAATPGVAARSASAVDKLGKDRSDRFTEFQTSQLSAQQMIGSLNKIISNPDLAHAVGSIGATEGGIQGTKGADVRAQIDVAAGQAVPLAAALIKAAGVPRASQMEIMAAANGLEGALHNYKQDAPSYISNVKSAITRLQDRMRVAEASATRAGVIAPRPSPNHPILRGSQAPVVGAVENGYAFLGGDPKNPKSWKAQ